MFQNFIKTRSAFSLQLCLAGFTALFAPLLPISSAAAEPGAFVRVSAESRTASAAQRLAASEKIAKSEDLVKSDTRAKSAKLAASKPTPVLGQDRCSKGPAPGCSCVHRMPHPTSLKKPPSCFLRFRSQIRPLSDSEKKAMRGVSFADGCPVALDKLRKVTTYHWGFDGKVYEGELVVAAEAAQALSQVFRQLYEAHFPIERMQSVEHFGGDDDASMAANNSSAFNCRKIAGTQSWSRHSFGDAIDLNPVQNPWVRGTGDKPGEVQPPSGKAFLNRQELRPGMVVEGGPAFQAFEQVGWKWGGHWRSVKDYQHFSKTGR